MGHGSQAGGASTISGVVYQILWSLLRTLKIRLSDPSGLTESVEAVVVLEPLGGGGDLQVLGRTTAVEQLKAKSDGGTWSLQTIIREVLPDLFLATANASENIRFRFVTEGRMGKWAPVYRFFRRLESVAPPADVLAALDSEQALDFQAAGLSTDRKCAFFAEDQYTERSLFTLMATFIATVPAIHKLGLAEGELHQRLWRLLSGFEFVGEQERWSIQAEIDRLLLLVADQKDRIPLLRDALAMSLLRQAAQGNAEISAESLLNEHGLKATPLANWTKLRSNSERELQRLVTARGYRPTFDVRQDPMQLVAEAWLDTGRILVISGESGQGKTWSLAATAWHAAKHTAPVIWVDATGDPKRDLETAANRFWMDIRGGETPLLLRQIAGRLSEVVPGSGKERLRVCLDNVTDYGEAASLIRDEWPALGVGMAMSCPTAVADSLFQAFPDAIQVVPCEDFSWEELHRLLKRRLGSAWLEIPDDLRSTLKRPLLASIYCEELFDNSWQATSEYELYSAVWGRLMTRQQTPAPFDAVALESLAERVVAGEPYPWTFQQLASQGIDDERFVRLEQCGWLVRTADGRAEVFHDRLLNWAVAQAFFAALRSGRRTIEDVATELATINKKDGRVGRLFLGYVPMDLLWLVTGNEEWGAQAGAKLLEALEPTYGHRLEVLYGNLAPTVGSRASGALFQRFCDHEGPIWVLRSMARALAAAEGEASCRFIEPLLASASPRQQRRGLLLLNHASCPKLLDQIWQLHVRGLAEPQPFLDEHEQNWILRDDSWKALKRSAANEPDWIMKAIARALAAVEPVHDLGWLLANLSDGRQAWYISKQQLFEKIDPTHKRLLARCIGLFRDVESIDWLRENLTATKHLILPETLQALSRLAPQEAAAALATVDLRELQMCSAWAASEVWNRAPDLCNAILTERANAATDPFDVAQLYRDHPLDLPVELLETLLDHLAKELGKQLKLELGRSEEFYRDFNLLGEALAPEHLDSFARRRGTALETNLYEYLRRLGARKGLGPDSLERQPGIELLRRIHGDCFTALINEHFGCDSRFGRLDALRWSMKRPDAATFEAATKIVERDELWDKYPFEQSEAMELLAMHGQWEGVARGFQRWGLETSYYLTRERVVPQNSAAPWVDKLRNQLDERPTAANVMALSFAGNQGDIARLHAILEKHGDDEQLAQACILGLEMLEDDSERGVELVAKQLPIKRLHHSATAMLSAAGTPAAWHALWNNLKTQFDYVTALNLLNLSEHAAEIAAYVVETLPTASHFGNWDSLRILICNLRKPELKAQLLDNSWLRESLHRESVATEGNSWIGGRKSSAIECLAEFDREAAFGATLRALENADGHDRERYPNLLREIDVQRAVPQLLDRLVVEKSESVKFAIGRALAPLECGVELGGRLTDSTADVRAAACFAAGWIKDGHDLRSDLCIALDDRSEKVIRQAMASLYRLRVREMCAELSNRTIMVPDLVSQWRYLDALVDVMDPGEVADEFPEILQIATEKVPLLVRKQLGDRLKKRRKELHDDLERHTRDR